MGVLATLKDGVASLRTCSREVYAILLLQVLESFNYFSLSITLADYLTASFGASDVEAGSLYGAWGAALVGAGMALGPLIDAAGVRRSLLLSATVTALSRAALAIVTGRRAAIAILLVPVSLGGALGSPVLTIGVKRAAPERARGFVYSLLYAAMNAAAFFAGTLRDAFVVGIPWLGIKPAGLRAYIAFGGLVAAVEVVVVAVAIHGRPPPGEGAAAGVAVAIAATAPRPHPPGPSTFAPAAACAPVEGAPVEGAPMEGAPVKGGRASPPPPHLQARRLSSMDGVGLLLEGGAPPSAPPLPSRLLLAAPTRLLASARSSLAAVAGPELLKYLAFSVLTINLKSVFRHLDATLPKAIVREFGCAAPAGAVYAINPAIIMALVPLVGAATSHLAPFDLIHWGGYVSAVSPLWMVAFPRSLAAAGAFVATLSIGEAVWSPPWYAYSMAVAPDGREGLFTALASAPLFAAKLPTGALSGWLLHSFCPGNGPCPGPGDPGPVPAPGACDPRTLWGVITAITLTSPFTILIFQRWLRPADKNKGGGHGGGGYERVEEAAGRSGDAGSGSGADQPGVLLN